MLIWYTSAGLGLAWRARDSLHLRYHPHRSRKRRLRWVGDEKPAIRQSCVYWYCPRKVPNSLCRIHFNWFNGIDCKLILLNLLFKSLFLRQILTAATFCYLIYFQPLGNGASERWNSIIFFSVTLNIFNLFDISFLAKSIFLYH